MSAFDLVVEGEMAYQEWREALLANPAKRQAYEQQAALSDAWLHLVDLVQDAGLTASQVAKRLGVTLAAWRRIERAGYDCCDLATLQRYAAAVGEASL